MPAPKDPIKLAEWKRKLSERSKGRKTWNTGLKYSELEEFDEYREKLSKVHKEREREPHSEETKAKISKSLKGKQTGKIVSQETRDKLSKVLTGKERSEEHRQNISKGRTGIKVSAEARQKMSRDRKGKPGTPHTSETKLRLSDLFKEKYKDPQYKATHGGQKHSEETKKKISALARARGKGITRSEETKKRMSDAAKGKKHNYKSPGFTGRKHSQESRAQLSATLTRKHRAGEIKLSINPTVYMSGLHESPKAGIVRYRSSWELQAYKKLDIDETVVTYSTEKIRIPYIYQDQERTYYPDLLILYVDESMKLIEIKPTELLLHPQNQAKFSAAKSLYDNFEVWTESDLETNL